MKVIRITALLVAAFTTTAAVHGQTYPVKSILVKSPVQAGSAGDTALRLVTQKMSQNMGQQLQVENTTGAAGMIGAQRLARATPDGYTIGGVSDSTVTYESKQWAIRRCARRCRHWVATPKPLRPRNLPI